MVAATLMPMHSAPDPGAPSVCLDETAILIKNGALELEGSSGRGGKRTVGQCSGVPTGLRRPEFIGAPFRKSAPSSFPRRYVSCCTESSPLILVLLDIAFRAV